ncbi:general substrate transporter [Cryphonectria parasitica EP155]|uniref:General substrate transporter n=1 Tax=Cryphonectria parasitica (strain ATCC 38755 / EP155) TaxID=660469 RepID=A0A9P4XW18_CRYP1|nr:general substrate transporter [Cryphonectria parasitica EP155]KAF3761862.1 general substrate transporter [Cryphonectria parasitica EP155]
MSGVLLADDFLQQMGQPSTFMQGFVTSVYELGCLAGCIVSFVFSERFGRKNPIYFGTCLVIIGAVLQTAAYGIPQFIVGRIVSGVGTGLNTSIIPIWQAEALPAQTREKFGSFQYLLVCFGASTAYWVNYGLSYASGAFEWRFATGAQMIFALLLLSILPLMPESPRWLMAHSRTDEALDVLLRMHGTAEQDDDEVQTEIKMINEAIELENMSKSVGWAELFTNHPESQNLRRISLAWWLMAMVMLSGVCSIGYYISYLFETSVGLSHNLSLLLSGFNGLWYMASAVIPPFIIHRIGKRGCMMLGAFGMGCCFLAMALGIRSGSFGASIVVIIAFFLYYTFFAIGYLAVPWLYCAEIMPLHLRSKGNAISTSSNWLWNFATVMMTPSTMSSQGWKGYLIFTVFNFAFIPFIYLFYPETSGRRLEQIDAIFYKTRPIVARTQWAKRGRFESDALESALADTKGSEPADKTVHLEEKEVEVE